MCLLFSSNSIVATPGRFLHIVMEMDLKLTLVEYVVFDEADRYVSSLIGGTWCETRTVETLFKFIGQLIEFSYVMWQQCLDHQKHSCGQK